MPFPIDYFRLMAILCPISFSYILFAPPPIYPTTAAHKRQDLMRGEHHKGDFVANLLKGEQGNFILVLQLTLQC